MQFKFMQPAFHSARTYSCFNSILDSPQMKWNNELQHWAVVGDGRDGEVQAGARGGKQRMSAPEQKKASTTVKTDLSRNSG